MDSVVPRNNFTFPRNAYLKMRERNSLHTVLNGNRLIKQNKVTELTKNNRRLKVFVSIKVYRKKIPPFIIIKPFRTFSIQVFMRKSIFFCWEPDQMCEICHIIIYSFFPQKNVDFLWSSKSFSTSFMLLG